MDWHLRFQYQGDRIVIFFSPPMVSIHGGGKIKGVSAITLSGGFAGTA
jgi:hypothetical protein